MARIAIIHLVAEARGIDMNPMTMAKLQSAGDKESTRVLTIIHADEITRMSRFYHKTSQHTYKQMSRPVIDGLLGCARSRVLILSRLFEKRYLRISTARSKALSMPRTG